MTRAHTTHFHGCECEQEKMRIAVEALQLVVDSGDRDGIWVDNWKEVYLKAREALAKIKGEK